MVYQYGVLVLPTTATIQGNTNIYESTSVLGSANYQVVVNVQNWCYFFNTAHYMQSTTNNDQFNTDLSLNRTYITNLLKTANTSVLTKGPNTNSINLSGVDATGGVNNSSLGHRLLEVAALSIFGSAKARAAIANDTQFDNLTLPSSGYTSHTNTRWVDTLGNVIQNQMVDIFTTDSSTVFNQYVNYNNFSGINLNNNDVTGNINYNFDGLAFQFVLTFNSNVFGQAGASSQTSANIISGFSQTISILLADNDAITGVAPALGLTSYY